MTPRIAVVDDESRMVEILSMVLRKEGYAVSPFTSSGSAAKALREERFDLLLTDLKMPAPDGLELLAIAKAAHRDMPVILLTAHATVTTAIAAIREGAFDYIEKPFDNDGLKALVARALEVERLERENRYLRGKLRGRHPINRHRRRESGDA
jgi:DNA-binding NtrC family response regulator